MHKFRAGLTPIHLRLTLLETRFDFLNRLLKLDVVLFFPRSRVDAVTRIGHVAEQPAKQAAGHIQHVGHGVAGRALKRALITAATAVAEELELKALICA